MRFKLLLGLSLVAVACRPAGRAATPGIVDDLGLPVALRQVPRRIVSLSPATTELLFALGLGDRVVGRTRWCDYPPRVAQVASVGDGLNPNVEAVAARKPDLVVMYASGANTPAVERLAQLRIPAVNLRMDRLDDVARSARLLGRLTGDSVRIDSLARAFQASLDSLRAVPHGATRRVAMVVWDNPPIVIGAGSYLTEFVTLAGGENVFDDVARPSATVSIETIASRNPDLLLIASMDSVAWVKRPEWQVVRAVREHHFGFLRGSEFNRPSFRAPDAVRRLAEILRGSGR